MLAADFAARLRARGHVIRQRGAWHDTTCPGHDDQHASLSFRDGNRGVILICRAGCTIVQIGAALDMPASVFTVSEKENGRHPALTVEALAAAKRLPVEFLQSLGVEQDGNAVRITYRLIDGTLAPRQRRRTALRAKDGSSWYPGEGSPVPYGLWRLSGAQAARKLVIVEGETDCWTAWHEGVTTLGFPGADTVKLLQARYLNGFEIVYILREPDRGGDTFVRGATRRLQELSWDGMIRILTMPDELKDLSDLRCKDPGRFGERLEAALAVAVPFDGAGATATDTQQEHASPRSPWAAAQPAPEFINAADPQQDFLEPRLLAAGSITEAFSPRGLGKTHVAHAIMVKLAGGGKRVLLIDRDNSRREVRRRLRAWGAGGCPTLKVLTRDEAPPLTDKAAWRAFPFADYDVVVIDSIDATAEGVGESDSAKPAAALALILDIAHREAGPAILVLGNVVKSGAHSRGSGIVEDRADIVYEVRDATDLMPGGDKPWWLELPAAGRDTWAERAVRRKRRDRYRLAFVPTKFRLGEEPDPFIVEINLSEELWTIRGVTEEVIAAGEAAQSLARDLAKRREENAVRRLIARIVEAAKAGTPLGKDQAEAYLREEREWTQRDARRLIAEGIGRHWRTETRQGARGRPKDVLLPMGAASAVPMTKMMDAESPRQMGVPDGSILGAPSHGPTPKLDPPKCASDAGIQEAGFPSSSATEPVIEVLEL